MTTYYSKSARVVSFFNFKLNPLNANPKKWSNTLKQIVGNLPTICLSVFDHFMNLALKGLKELRNYGRTKLASATRKVNTQPIFSTAIF